jgi:hypothetical protein
VWPNSVMTPDRTRLIAAATDLECHMTDPTVSDDVTHVDCDTCSARGAACNDCVITFLLGAPPSGVEIGREERQAIEALAAGGLVPPLRLVTPVDGAEVRGA